MPRFALIALALLGLAACQADHPADAASATASVDSLDSALGRVSMQVLSDRLDHPWGMAFLPNGDLLITERGGQLRRLSAEGELSAPFTGVPAVVAEGQGGLLDIALSPQFEQDRGVYLSYAEAGEGRTAGTAVARARLDGNALTELTVIFRQHPKLEGRHHFGSRLVFDRDGHLFITLGDRGDRLRAQDLSNHQGTLIRIRPDGSVPADNPFVGREDALPEIWSYGHRNQQGADLNPWTGQVWTHEHGPRGGDEVNIPQAGRNYGWPVITHGIDYSGVPISEAVGRAKQGMEQPHYVWEVSPAVSGMAFYDHPRFPTWRNSLFIGALAQTALIRLSLNGDKVVGEERLLEAQGWRIRAVKVGPDGAVYVLTDEDRGRVLKLELQG